MKADVFEGWAFRYDTTLRGYVTGGQEHGLEFSQGADALPVTRRMCMNVEHYWADDATGGPFVPRKIARLDAERTGEREFMLVIHPTDAWNVRVTVTFTLLQDCLIEARYAFEFGADYGHFTTLVSAYFHEPTTPLMHVGGRWQQVPVGENEHRTWARTPEGAAHHAAGAERRAAEVEAYFHALGHTDFAMAEDNTDPAPYDLPAMISPIRDSGWSVVQWIDRAECASLSANRCYTAHDFSLVGRDVAAGETVMCRAWIGYRELASPDDALTQPEEWER